MDKNQDTILNELFAKPTHRFYIRELARTTKLHPNTVIKTIKELEKQGIIKKENKNYIVEISLNLDNKKTILKKRLSNLTKLLDSGLVELLAEKYSPKSISLIGSYSRGEDIESSDVDIVLFANKKEILDLSKFEKILNRKIQLLILDKEKISDEFFNNLINGIVLYGAIRK